MAVADAIEAGFKQVLPDATYVKLPVVDGGEGDGAIPGGCHRRPHPAGGGDRPRQTRCRASSVCWGWRAGRHRDGGRLRHASGGTRAAQSLHTSSFGTGELILAALEMGVTHLSSASAAVLPTTAALA